jgi:oligoribonuclease (3'-5' exoribonuclease)
MIIASIDIETTGLDPDLDQILEFACVIENFDVLDLSSVEDLPFFHCYITHPRIFGNPFALHMNANILGILSGRTTTDQAILTLDEFIDTFDAFIFNTIPGNESVIPAGKNFGGFDQQFLRRVKGWGDICKDRKFSHRALDPAPLCLEHDDKVLPNLQVCLERSGLTNTVTHTALDDARDVLRVLRAKYRGYAWGL